MTPRHGEEEERFYKLLPANNMLFEPQPSPEAVSEE